MIVRCSCRHVYQDQKYGPGFRVHNTTKTGNVRCTVCATEKSVAAVVKK